MNNIHHKTCQDDFNKNRLQIEKVLNAYMSGLYYSQIMWTTRHSTYVLFGITFIQNDLIKLILALFVT